MYIWLVYTYFFALSCQLNVYMVGLHRFYFAFSCQLIVYMVGLHVFYFAFSVDIHNIYHHMYIIGEELYKYLELSLQSYCRH